MAIEPESEDLLRKLLSEIPSTHRLPGEFTTREAQGAWGTGRDVTRDRLRALAAKGRIEGGVPMQTETMHGGWTTVKGWRFVE